MAKARRMTSKPILDGSACASLGGNLNGPSLIKVPDWVKGARARYYLYFAHHEGRHIRLAFADHLEGPWTVHAPGALGLDQTPFPSAAPDVPQPAWAVAMGVDGLYPHIASPDVHVDHQGRRLVMWFHGLDHDGEQRSLRATSINGLDWRVEPNRFDPVYLRVFHYAGRHFALAHGGQMFAFEHGGLRLVNGGLFAPGFRHGAVRVVGDRMQVVWTAIGDAPERIYQTDVHLRPDPADWQAFETLELLRPDLAWEGADCPIVPSQIGTASPRENALRDPCYYEEGGRVYMVYAGSGEAALGIAELVDMK